MIFDDPISPKRAHAMVKQAIRDGRIVKPRCCARCKGGIRVLAHHKDYRKPLDIEFLCDSCHQRRHRPMIVPWCEPCGTALLHRKQCRGRRVPKLNCGLCRKLGHSRVRCLWPRGLRRCGPKCGRVLRRPYVLARIATINNLLIAIKWDVLPNAAAGEAFVVALARTALLLATDPRNPRKFPLHEQLRNECAALGDEIIRAVLPGTAPELQETP